jgi:hypothetical protein
MHFEDGGLDGSIKGEEVDGCKNGRHQRYPSLLMKLSLRGSEGTFVGADLPTKAVPLTHTKTTRFVTKENLNPSVSSW